MVGFYYFITKCSMGSANQMQLLHFGKIPFSLFSLLYFHSLTHHFYVCANDVMIVKKDQLLLK